MATHKVCKSPTPLIILQIIWKVQASPNVDGSKDRDWVRCRDTHFSFFENNENGQPIRFVKAQPHLLHYRLFEKPKPPHMLMEAKIVTDYIVESRE